MLQVKILSYKSRIFYGSDFVPKIAKKALKEVVPFGNQSTNSTGGSLVSL